ncbi:MULTISPECIES: hypothetical protein [unclassified Modestobacter]|uniref:hypothetical protein n=1 Tax=unclassified Modestobacter TaxID=2643866 RepID=UPI0022AA4667|nr:MULTISPECIES: hypothetical protein [unclassified Modestobacter]MCZ2825825.1 hypothetical protein [Modestobacter sp. VKM Ac-2981]MCZ2853110.1 hypothetical protein [Modestobacter sp. VKM Ac-2982]
MSGPGAFLRLFSAALVVLALLGGLLVGTAGPAAAASAEPWSATRVVDVGVAGLTWSDLDPERTPELWALAEESAIGALSVRAARPTTCLLDGWATLGAGNRARYPGPVEPVPPVSLPSVPIPDEDVAVPDGAGAEEGPAAVQLDTRLSWCGLEEQVADVGLAEPQQTVARVAADEATARFGAEPGALGEAVGCSTVVGRAGSLAVAGETADFTVRDRLPTEPAELAALLAECPLTVVSLDQLTDAGAPAVEETDTGTQPSRREAALAVIDQAIGRLRDAVAELPGDTLLLLQGVSEVNGGRPQLHVGLASGPGVPPSWLTSASTGRVPFVQLIDVAPTILRALDLDPVASMNGQPFRVAGDRPDLATAIAELEQINTSAVVHYRSTSTTFWALVLLNGVLVVLGLLGLGGWASGWLPGRGRVHGWLQRRTPGPRRTAALRVAALAVAAVPISTYLANLVPWELSSAPRAALAGSVLGCTLVVTAVAALGPWRRTRLGPAIAVLAITLATLVADVLTGSHLELDGLLGYDAIVAGRFTGYGNLSFGLLAVSSLLLTAAAAALVARRVRAPGRRHWLLPVLVAGVGTVVVIGAPSLGRDFGGVLAAVPGFLVLGMLLGRIRVTVVRLVAVLAVAVLAVGTVAVFDWLGPAEERSHLGRFVGQVLDGQAWTVVSRKAQANLNILLGSPLAWMLLVALVAGVWLLRPGGLLRSRPGRPAAGLPAADVRVLRAGLTAVALSLTLGALVNDSGVALPATAATVLVPLLVWLVAGAPGDEEAGRPSPDQAPASAPEAPETRVNVGVRGSTGRTS